MRTIGREPARFGDGLHDMLSRTPLVAKQLRIAGIPKGDPIAARFLRLPRRSYQKAVTALSPYDRTQETYPDGRTSLQMLIEQAIEKRKPLFAFVNNRRGGSAADAIEGVLTQWF
ncbi:MAG: hypothetical protein KF841_10230 [Phycisphaerae bacterium]|nr:hypothetical protein [Phycisphaerae bacterium]